MYESCIKRLLDLILSLAACVVLAIPMGIIALWIKKIRRDRCSLSSAGLAAAKNALIS